MVTLFWAAKGGSGTTVVVSSLALKPTSQRHTLIVDLAGEVPDVLGIPAPEQPGVADWAASDAPAAHLADLLVDVGPQVSLLPACLGRPDADRARPLERLGELASWLTEWEADVGGDVLIDAGTGDPPPELAAVAERCLLVTRACYLAITRASRARCRPTGVVVVAEQGRSLRSSDIERAVGAPVVATVRWSHDVARAVDAGLLGSRLPRLIGRELRRAAA